MILKLSLANCQTKMMTMKNKPKLGSGTRFKQLTSKLAKRGVKNPKALAAYIGRKKYGKTKFQQLAAKGKR
jgi:hypothetical protein